MASSGGKSGSGRPPVALTDQGPPRDALERLPLPPALRTAIAQARDGENVRVRDRTRQVLAALRPLPLPTQAQLLQAYGHDARRASDVLARLVHLVGEDRTLLSEMALVAGACAGEIALLEELLDDPTSRWKSPDLASGRTLLFHAARLATDAPSAARPACAALLEACLLPHQLPAPPAGAPPTPQAQTPTPLAVAAAHTLLLHFPAEFARLAAGLCVPPGKVKTSSGVELPAPSGPPVPPRLALELALSAQGLPGPALLEALTRHPYAEWRGEGDAFLERMMELLSRVASAEVPVPLVLQGPGMPPQAYLRAPEGELHTTGFTELGHQEVRHRTDDLPEGPWSVLAPRAMLEAFQSGKPLPTFERAVDPQLVWFRR